MKKAVVEIQNFVSFEKSQNLPASEHDFGGSISKYFKKELFLHQIKYNFLRKTSLFL